MHRFRKPHLLNLLLIGLCVTLHCHRAMKPVFECLPAFFPPEVRHSMLPFGLQVLCEQHHRVYNSTMLHAIAVEAVDAMLRLVIALISSSIHAWTCFRMHMIIHAMLYTLRKLLIIKSQSVLSDLFALLNAVASPKCWLVAGAICHD